MMSRGLRHAMKNPWLLGNSFAAAMPGLWWECATHQIHFSTVKTTPGTFLTAEWKALAMLNFEVEPAVLQPFVPIGTELDTWNGKTFVSMVGFLFLRTRIFGIPILFHHDFEEVNLRFYVRRKADDGWRRGVVFIKEIVPRAAIASIARTFYNEPY